MKSNVIIAALIIVILFAGGAAVYFSLQKSAKQNEADNRETALPKGGNEAPNTTDKPADEEPTQPAHEVKPDDKPVPDKEPDVPAVPDEVDKLLNTIHRNQASLYSLTANITMVGYNTMRHDKAHTNEDKIRVGDVAKGEYAYKPGNKFYAHLRGDDEETDIYAYMQSLWFVTKSGSETRASRSILGSSTMYEMILLLQGARPEDIKRIFEIEILDTRDSRTRNTLKHLGYDENQMPYKYPERREILLLTYLDRTVGHSYDRIELVIDYVKAARKSGHEDEVPVIRMAKLYMRRDKNSDDDSPMFESESIFVFADYDLDFTGEKALPDEKFRYTPGPDVKVEDYLIGRISGKAEILGRMQQTREFIAGFQAKMRSESVEPAKDEPNVIEGSLFYMEKPDRFKMETETMKLGSNGEKAWMYDPEKKEAKVYDLLKRAQSGEKAENLALLELYRMLVSQRFYELQDEFRVDFDRPQDDKAEKINGRDVLHLVMTREKNAQLPAGSVPKINYTDKVELWIDVETFLTVRVRTYDRYDSRMIQTITLSDIETDRAIDDEVFALPEFPEGTKIENR